MHVLEVAMPAPLHRVHAPNPPERQNARLEDVAARDARLSVRDPQPDDHGHDARAGAGKEGALARLGALGAGGAEATSQGDMLPEPTE